jgi:hypothetical protein
MINPRVQARLEECLEDEACVIECLQEMPGDRAENKQLLIAYFQQLAQDGSIGFFLDELGGSAIEPISVAQGLERLLDAATWDPQQEPNLHVHWL